MPLCKCSCSQIGRNRERSWRNAFRSCLVTFSCSFHHAMSIGLLRSISDILANVPSGISPSLSWASIAASSVFCQSRSLFSSVHILLISESSYLLIIFFPPMFVGIDGFGHPRILHDNRLSSIFFRPYQNKKTALRMRSLCRFQLGSCGKTESEEQYLLRLCLSHGTGVSQNGLEFHDRSRYFSSAFLNSLMTAFSQYFIEYQRISGVATTRSHGLWIETR